MREAMERFSILPFSIRCVSHSSIDVIEAQPKKSHRESVSSPPRGGEPEEDQKPKNSLELAHISKPSIGERLQKLVKSIKNLPSVFQVYKEEEEEEDGDGDGDDDEVEMVIGLPTDVQHVGHIGWDGSNENTTVSTIKNWDTAPGFM